MLLALSFCFSFFTSYDGIVMDDYSVEAMFVCDQSCYLKPLNMNCFVYYFVHARYFMCWKVVRYC